MKRDPHTHYCPDCNSRYQCIRVGCFAGDECLCDPCFDAETGWPVLDPKYDHEIEECRWLREVSNL